MVTICSFCGREINENNEINKDKKYLLCKCNNGFIPKGANSYKSKGGKTKMTKGEKVEMVCSVCGKKKMRSERFAFASKFKDTPYVCNKCKKKE